MSSSKLVHTFFLFLFFSSIIGQENQNEYNFVAIDDGFTQSAITSIKPPVFWKDKPQFVSQAKKVNLNILKEIMEDVSDTELMMKKN